MANCITIAKGMQFWGTHGFFPEENKFGAKFVVDITAESDETGKCQNDDYSTGVSYLTLYNCAKKVVTTEQHKMVQRIAQRISDEIFEASDAVEKVTITVKKSLLFLSAALWSIPVAPLPGPVRARPAMVTPFLTPASTLWRTRRATLTKHRWAGEQLSGL